MKIRKIVRVAMLSIGCLLVAAGVALATIPYVVGVYLDHKVSAQAEAVEEGRDTVDNRQKGIDDIKDDMRMESVEDVDVKETDALYQAMSAYNARIYDEGQAGIIDLGTFEGLPEELEPVVDGAIGYVEIPSIDVKLPLFVGASNENMANGAAILSNTSMPIGGENTNCVIAGHRGYYGGKYFKDIEEIAIGDSVFITNPWETLEYIVEGFDIVEPSDADAVKIHEGKDLVTLLTCHPYASNGKYRYLVYCVPAASSPNNAVDVAQDAKYIDQGTSETIGLDRDSALKSSKSDIKVEETFRIVSVCFMMVVVAIYIIHVCRTHRKKSQ